MWQGLVSTAELGNYDNYDDGDHNGGLSIID